MVFFTVILVVSILYFLQADGLLFVTVIALIAELINIFMTHTLTKSVEKKLNARHKKAVQGYLARIKAQKKTIKDLEKIQEDAAGKIYKANSKIKDLEEKIKNTPQDPNGTQPAGAAKPEKHPGGNNKKTEPEQISDAAPKTPEKTENHLPDGSNRKIPPV